MRGNDHSTTNSKVTKGVRITIRINEQDLQIIKQKALENGLPYQTLITTILHQYANGKIQISL